MMKRLEWLTERIVLVSMFLTGGVASAQTITDFFDDTALQEIHLDVNPADWASIKANPRSDTYYEANFRWRGLEVDGIGIRQRGNATRNGTKPGLRVDFNRYESGRTFLGMKSLGLDNNAQDASMVKERVIMEVYTKLGLPAPHGILNELSKREARLVAQGRLASCAMKNPNDQPLPLGRT